MADEFKNQNVALLVSAGMCGDSLAVGGRNSIEIGIMVSFQFLASRGCDDAVDLLQG